MQQATKFLLFLGCFFSGLLGAQTAVLPPIQPIVETIKPLSGPRNLEITSGAFVYEPIVNHDSQTPSGVFNSSMMFLAEQLDRNLLSQHRGRKTLVTNMVDLNDVQQTNALGRMLSEHLMHELAVRLWAVVDVRANVGLILNETGEFLLTRNTTRGHTNHSDGMVVTGTYMTTTDGVLVNLKVLDAVTSQVLSTAQTRLESSVFLSRLAAKPMASKTMKITN
jgi:TolB-like protein